MGAQQPNRRLAIGIAAFGVIGALVCAAILIILPESSVRFLNRVPIKVLLVVSDFIAFAWIGIISYRILYEKRSRRLLQTLFYSILLIGGTYTVSSFGILVVENMEIDVEGFHGVFKFLAPDNKSPILAMFITFAALLFTLYFHIEVSKHEQKYGPLT